MAKIPASESATFTVNAPIAKVYDFLSKPAQLKGAMTQLVNHEFIGDNRARWVLEEKREKGITFQPDYTVEYAGNGSTLVTWKTVAGNVDLDGRAELRAVDDQRTEVRYNETMAPDLPIPSLMAKVFKPIVARNVKQGLGEYIEHIRAALNRL